MGRSLGDEAQSLRDCVVVSLTVSPVKNAEGQIVGASKIARDITEQKRSQEQIATLAREAEHRSKNLLATVQATVRLSQSETLDGLNEGRIQSLANVHSLVCPDTLGWCRPIDDSDTGTRSLFQEGPTARAHRRSPSVVRA